jgi:hypothetical protein
MTENICTNCGFENKPEGYRKFVETLCWECYAGDDGYSAPASWKANNGQHSSYWD